MGFLLTLGLPKTQDRGCIPESSTKPVQPVAAPALLGAALVLSLPSPQEESSNPNQLPGAEAKKSQAPHKGHSSSHTWGSLQGC